MKKTNVRMEVQGMCENAYEFARRLETICAELNSAYRTSLYT